MNEIRYTARYLAWYETLKDVNIIARIGVRLKRIQNGNMGDIQPVGGGVSEIRIDYGPGYRIYFTVRKQQVVILLAGGDKRTQHKDITKAVELAKKV
jgi:putative addiction module killer protein